MDTRVISNEQNVNIRGLIINTNNIPVECIRKNKLITLEHEKNNFIKSKKILNNIILENKNIIIYFTGNLI